MKDIRTSRSFKWAVTTAAIVILAYIVTWHFYAMWWFIIEFVDLIILLLWIITALNSVVFWIRDRKKYHSLYLSFCIHLVTALVLAFSPSLYRNKAYSKYAFNICNRINNNCSDNLVIEMYIVFKGGTGESDLYSVYITDQKNFRKYIGVSDERNENIEFRCNGTSIISTKTSNEGLDTYWIAPKVLEQKTFNLKELKDSHHFD